HARPVPNPALTKHKNTACQHVDARQITNIAADCDHPPPHRVSDFVPCVSANQDRALGHPFGASTIRRAHQMPSFAAHMNQPAMHLAAHPIPGISQHMNLATSHLAANMPSAIA